MPLSRANGVDIWYEVKGAGPALVFIHANPFDHDLWMYQAAHFSTWFRVVGIDIRGYGRSAKVTTPYALTDMCDDVIGVMDDLGIARAVCGGCSVGSSIAHPAGPRSSRTGSTPSSWSAATAAPATATSSASTTIATIWRAITSSICAIWCIRNSPTAGSAAISSTSSWSASRGCWARPSRRCSWPAITPIRRRGCRPWRSPTLVINGEFDHSLPAGQKTAGLVPGAVHKVLPGTGHACCIEDPAGFDALVIDFLRARALMPAL